MGLIWTCDLGHEVLGIGTMGAIASSDDARWLASGGASGAVALWNLRSGALHTVLRSGDSPVESLAFHPTGQWLACLHRNNQIDVFSIDSDLRHSRRFPTQIRAVGWSRSGGQLLTGSLAAVTAYAFDAEAGLKDLHLLGKPGCFPQVLGEHEDGRVFVLGHAGDRTLFSSCIGTPPVDLRVEQSFWRPVALSPAGLIAIGTKQQAVALCRWDADAALSVRPVELGSGESLSALAFSRSSVALYAVSDWARVFRYDVSADSFELLAGMTLPHRSRAYIAPIGLGSAFAFGPSAGPITLVQADERRTLREMHDDFVNLALLDAEGDACLTSSPSRTVVWSLASQTETSRVADRLMAPGLVDTNGSFLLSDFERSCVIRCAASGRTQRIWSTTAGDYATALAFHAASNRLAIGTRGGQVLAVALDDGEPTARLIACQKGGHLRRCLRP